MPSYEYVCPTCKAEQTQVRSIHDPIPVVACTCGETMNRRYFAAPAHFKGTGWAGKSR